MGDISIRVRHAATGVVVEAELPDDEQMKVLLPILAEKLSIQNAGELRLKNKTRNFEYNDTDTLAGKGTKTNDLCLLSHEVVQGIGGSHA
jgi:hypothetical protein